MSTPSRRALSRELFWLTLLCSGAEVMVIGSCARVTAPQTWLVLLGLAFFTAHGLQWLLQRRLAPLSQLQLAAAAAQDNRSPAPRLRAERFAPFEALAEATDGLLVRLHQTPAEPATASPDTLAGERRSLFLRSVSHELRTPLNAILGFTEILLSEMDGPVDVDQRENLTIIRDSGRRLLQLVNDVLELASLATTQAPEARQTVNVHELLDEVREGLEERRGLRLVHVRVEVATDAQRLTAERGVLSRILRVLAEYVFDATEGGELVLTAKREGPCWSLGVHGEGAALGVERLQALLSAGAAAERRMRADALRLAIVQELLQARGGSVQAARAAAGAGGFALQLPAEVP